MKKLFLTSTGLQKETRNYFLDLLNKKPKDTTVAFIPTAADPEDDKWFVKAALDEIAEIGMKVVGIDLKKENKTSLKNKLSTCDIVYVNGGNTFYLLDWVRKSGFDEIVKQQVNEGKIYIGVSAGSIITGPNIEISGWGDGDKNTVNLNDLTGLNLVNFSISPHFIESDRQLLDEMSKKVSYPVVALSNSQAIMITNDKIEIVGVGEKISFNGFKEKSLNGKSF